MKMLMMLVRGSLKRLVASNESRYWLTVNRYKVTQYCKACPPWPSVSPRPEVLIGFCSKQERSHWKNELLGSPPETFRWFIEKMLPKLAREGKVIFKTYDRPEAPSSGTEWIVEGGAA